MTALETQLAQWRAAVLRGRAVTADDADELEAHLREQIADLRDAGLTDDEAFLVGVRRLGEVDALTAEFAREHGDRLWKQLVVSHEPERPRSGAVTAIVFAAIAAALLAVGANLLGDQLPRNASLFVLPVLTAYLATVRRMPLPWLGGLAGAIAAVAVAVNVFPFARAADTEWLVAVHLPVLLWFAVGVAYVAGEVRSHARRMDFIRFSGEWALYLALIALGGAVLMMLTGLVLAPIVPALWEQVMRWGLPAGIGGAVIVSAWLVEAKQSIIENLAPVLTAIFTPLFAAMLVVSAAVYGVDRLGLVLDRDSVAVFDRDALLVFDALLLVVLALVVYGISARDRLRRAGLMDVLRLVAVIAAIVLDVLVLTSMLQRVGELGFTPNRVAALGLNIILLVNLMVTAVLAIRVLAGRSRPARMELWQTGYLPVFAAWAAVVVLVLPPVFGFR